MSTNKPAGGAQFTPGPWSLCNWMVGNNTPTGEVTICGPEGDEHICTMDGNEDNQANGNLIAAAPAMYEALQAIEARLQGVFDSPALMKQGMLTHDKSTDVIRFVQTALAQAEGRQG